MKKQVMASIAAMCILASGTMGCASTPAASSAAQGASSSAASTASAASQGGNAAPTPVTLTAMICEQAGAPLNKDMLVFKELAEKTGVTFEFSNVAGADYGQKAQTALASDSMPDIMEWFGAGFDPTEYIFAGKFVKLDDYLASSGQNILKAYKDLGVDKNAKFSDGSYYELYTLLQRKYYLNNTMNQDWLDELKLEMPTTMEELYKVLTAFRDAKSADGGVAFAVSPWSGGAASVTNMVKKTYAATSGFQLYDDGYFFGPYERQDRYKAALTWLANAYKDKLLDQQMFSITDDESVKNRNNGKYGFYSGWGDGIKSVQDKGFNMVAAPVMDTEFGQGWEVVTEPRSASLLVTKNCKDPEAFVRAVDYLYSEEGQLLSNWGVKDVTYTEDASGNRDFTDLIKNDGDQRYKQGLSTPHFPCIVSKEVEYLVYGSPIKDIEKLLEGKSFPLQPRLVATSEETREFTQIMADIDKYVGETETMFITGELSIEKDFDAFIAMLEKMNIKRAIEIKQAQYQRYLASNRN